MKRILITGVTSGIGLSLFKHFVKTGHYVIGVARNKEKIETLRRSMTNSTFKLYQSDFASLESLKALSEKVLEDYSDGLDILINNAAIVPSEKTLTIDGFERQYQVNHLSVVYLTHALHSLLEKGGGKIIITGSDAHKKAKFDAKDIDATKHYHALRSYARTKLYNLMFAHWLSESKDDIPCYVVSPGRVKTGIGTKETSRFHALFWKLFTVVGKNPDEVIKTYEYLINTPEASLKNTYYHNALPEGESPLASDHSNIRVLMKKTFQDLKL
jgi:NAD(P)-dependent dehydrogenase (short-subunit alcohol dehydrogenase family)